MKILIGSNVHWWNAEAAYAATIAELLQQAGHEVYVLTRPDSLNAHHLQTRNLNIITHIDLNSNNPFILWQAYQNLKSFLNEKQIDLINAHRSEGFPLFVFAKKSLFKKTKKYIPVIRTRGTTRTVRPHWLNRKLLQDWTDAHIFAGRIVQQRMEDSVPLTEDKKRVIYYPVQIPKFETSPKKQYLDEFNISDHAKIVAIVGRIRNIKGQRILVQSLQQLLNEFPDLVLLIAYRDTDETEPEMIALQNDIRIMKLEKNIRLLSQRNDIRAIMSIADVGVVSSIDSEVICRVAVEFFSVGVPVVAFPTGCLPEIIIHEKNGLLTNDKTAESLSENLRKILIDNHDIKRYKHDALEDAQNRFDPYLMLEKTLEVYNQVLKNDD